MIAHFLWRDLRDNALAWITLLSLTALAGLLSWSVAADYGLMMLGWGYVMFGTMLSASTMGSVWRTQHQLARHYLLALPIRHRRLFAIQQARMLVPWMPLVTLVAMMPLLGVTRPPGRSGVWALYYGGIVVSVGLLIQHGLWMALEMERIAAYLPKGARFRAHVKTFVALFAMWIPLYGAWIELIDNRMWMFFPWLRYLPTADVVFPAGLIVLVLWLRHNARRWCVTL